ncbi:serine hydroxymethyltransferase [Striga asiatica]|uniref:Serine hydroxymethyltransferase n=1 Tax=Striga asiatica TaxID=4170 RepID=A0A5A7R0I9_STRAF|nr:serine hydroxymethyltransferase [Striga asiatica]
MPLERQDQSSSLIACSRPTSLTLTNEWDYARSKTIMNKYGTVLLCDMDQINGLVASSECDILEEGRNDVNQRCTRRSRSSRPRPSRRATARAASCRADQRSSRRRAATADQTTKAAYCRSITPRQTITRQQRLEKVRASSRNSNSSLHRDTSVMGSKAVCGLMEGNRPSSLRYFSDDKGRVLSEEERAKETVYIQKMERERMEKLKKKAEQEKAEKEKSDKRIKALISVLSWALLVLVQAIESANKLFEFTRA